MPKRNVTLDELIRGIRDGDAIVVERGYAGRLGVVSPQVRNEDPNGMISTISLDGGATPETATSQLIAELLGALPTLTVHSARDAAERVIDVSQGLDGVLAKEWTRIRFIVKEQEPESDSAA
jgi:hypothetical protein